MIANRTFDRPFGGGGLEGSMASRADLRVKSLCQNSARIGRSPYFSGGQRGVRGHLSREQRKGPEGTRVPFAVVRNRTPRDTDVRAGAPRKIAPKPGFRRPPQSSRGSNECVGVSSRRTSAIRTGTRLGRVAGESFAVSWVSSWVVSEPSLLRPAPS